MINFECIKSLSSNLTKENFQNRLGYQYGARFLDDACDLELLLEFKKNKSKVFTGQEIFAFPICLCDHPEEMFEVFDDRRQLEYVALAKEFQQRQEENKKAKKPLFGKKKKHLIGMK